MSDSRPLSKRHQALVASVPAHLRPALTIACQVARHSPRAWTLRCRKLAERLGCDLSTASALLRTLRRIGVLIMVEPPSSVTSTPALYCLRIDAHRRNT
jgi:DNA-binding IclR family transcriptional regulator